MIHASTLSEAFEAHIDSPKGVNFIEGEQNETFYTFRQLRDRALGILHHMQLKGASPKSEMIILVNKNEAFIDAFWGSIFGGIIPVPLATGISDEHRLKVFRVFKQLQNAYLFTDQKNLERLKAYAESNDLLSEYERLENRTVALDQIDDISVAGTTHQAAPQDTAFIQFSSGSTSEPKGIVVSHESLVSNMNAIALGINSDKEDIVISWMPLTHDMGLIGFHMTFFLWDIEHHIMSTDLFIRRPLLWLGKAAEKRASVLCSPNFGFKHYLNAYTPDKAEGLDLSRVRAIYNGAEPISVSLCHQFLDTLAQYGMPRTAMFPVYGLAEATLAAAFPEYGIVFETISIHREHLNFGDKIQLVDKSSVDAVEMPFVGTGVKDCDLRITDENRNPVPDSTIGKIEIHGINVTKGYYNNEAVNREVITEDGWLDTGDLGFIHDGKMVITGRAKDIIFVNGQNYYPHDIENVLTQIEQVDLGKVVVCGVRTEDSSTDDIIVFILHKGKADKFVDLANEARKHVNTQTGLSVAEVVPVRKIPKTTSGKVQRYRMGESFLNGEFNDILNELHTLVEDNKEDADSQGAIETLILDICHQIIEEKTIGATENIFEVGTSSLALAQIHEKLDEIYPDKIDVTDFFEYPTIRELAGFLEEKIKSS